MGQKEKLIKHLKSNPKDFTFNDAETMFVQTKEKPVVPE